MALTPDERPPSLADLLEDERGSAAVEFVVLIPVYITLMVMLFSLSQMSMAQQALAQASRVDAWTAGAFDDQALDAAFFGPYDGVYASEATPSPVVFQADDLRTESGSSGDVRVRQIALSMLNNDLGKPDGDSAPIHRHRLEASFTYQGIILGTRNIVMQFNPVVYLPNLSSDFARPEHESGKQEHFIADSSLNPPFDPAREEYRYLSPEFDNFWGPGEDEENPGIWARDARIGGNVDAERRVYVRKGNFPDDGG